MDGGNSDKRDKRTKNVWWNEYLSLMIKKIAY